MRLQLVLCLSLVACEKAPVAPVVEPAPAPPPPKIEPTVRTDAGPPVPRVPPDVLDGAATEGVPDDAPLDTDDLREANLQRLLLRDPDHAIRVLEQAPAPSAFHVAVLANLAMRRKVEGPPMQGKELPLPPLPASGLAATAPGPAFVGVAQLEVRASAKGKIVATLPTATAVTIEKLAGTTAVISTQLATRVDFGSLGTTPKAVVTTKVAGVVPLDALVTSAPDVGTLSSLVASQEETDAGRDAAVVYAHRAFLLSPSEYTRAQLLGAAWKARRPSWVASAALEPVWVTAKAFKAAWACRGDLSRAKWVPVSEKPPADACFANVDLRTPCSTQPPAVVKRRETLTTLGHAEPAPVIEVVVDATRARRLWAVSMPIRPVAECDDENDEHKIDIFGASIRRLQLPLGTSSLIVSLPVVGWHGVEHSIVGAQSEAKARDWLRSRTRTRWTYDSKGEPSPSLSVGDTTFRTERDVASHSIGRLPQLDCELCGGADFR